MKGFDSCSCSCGKYMNFDYSILPLMPLYTKSLAVAQNQYISPKNHEVFFFCYYSHL